MADRELYDLEVGSVDLVGKAANGRKWLLWKADDAPGPEDVDKAEVSDRDWSSVDKSKLPRACFLWTTGDKKEDWHLPVYEGAGEVGEDGMYSQRGALNANAVRAALAAVGGARTGKAMSVPSEIKAKLDRLAAQCGIGEANGEKATKADESDSTVKGGKPDMAEETKDVVTKEQIEAMQKALDDAKVEAEAQKVALAKAQERIEAQARDMRQGELAQLCKDAGLDFAMVWKAEQTMPEVAAHFIEKLDALTKQVNKLLGQEVGTERHDDRDDISKFEGEVERVAKEQKIPVRDALAQVAKEHPEWAEAHRLAKR